MLQLDAYQNRANAVCFDSHGLGRAYEDLDDSKKIAVENSVLDVWKSDLESDPDFNTLWAADPARKQALVA
ncbi:MAG TPA: hypothetical protein VMR62_07450 [Bryobacteraceae bacterium]|jgi:hypothetical protein|nr:hypothetical protein [Bryobacteraceae bacterium]